MRRLALVIAAALTALLAAASGSRAADPVLTADVGVGDAFTISLVDSSGSPVRHLDPGTYTLLVHDHSSFHNFHLIGPGVDVATDVDGIGDSTFTISLTDGTYRFQCDPHATEMKGSFTAGTVVAPPPKPAPTKLAAAIGAGSRSTLKPTTGLSAGTFVITVDDRSATDGFTLSGPGVRRSTGLKFRGRTTWTVKLAAGSYRYGSSKSPKLRHSLAVAAAST